jgi:peptide deformylase
MEPDTTEPVIEQAINPEELENASVNGERPHMNTLRLPAIAQEMGIHFSPPNEVERVICEEMTDEDITPEHLDLTKKMLRLLAEINGLGLAAPQIGINKKFMVYWEVRQNMPYVCYNPKYYPDGHKGVWAEKCLTYGEITFAVKRFKGIRAIWWEYNPSTNKLEKKSKTLHGLQAEVFQHETDHLNGITIATMGTLVR